MDLKVNEQARALLLAEVAGLTDEDVNKKPSDDAWSINQVLEHLHLIEDSVVKTLKQHIKSGKEEEAKKRRIEATVNRDIKVDAPEDLVPSEDRVSLQKMTDKLTTSHQALQDLIRGHDEEVFTNKALQHPVFGKMSLDQWIEFLGYHEMRHTQQIKEVKQLFEM